LIQRLDLSGYIPIRSFRIRKWGRPGAYYLGTFQAEETVADVVDVVRRHYGLPETADLSLVTFSGHELPWVLPVGEICATRETDLYLKERS
jgi:hypothetical protein